MNSSNRTVVDLGMPLMIAIFQVDYRLALILFRTQMGEWIMPADFHRFLSGLVMVGGLVRLGIGWGISHLGGNAVSCSAYLLENWPKTLTWTVAAVVVYFVARSHAMETRFRAIDEQEIIPTGFLGWPRRMDVDAHVRLQPTERRKNWAVWTLAIEPWMGLPFCVLGMFIDFLFGIYMLMNLGAFWVINAQTVHIERMNRLNLMDSMHRATVQQRLIEELQGTSQPAAQQASIGE